MSAERRLAGLAAVTRRRLLGAAPLGAAGAAGVAGALGAACGPGGGAPGAGGQATAPATLEFFHEWDGVRTRIVEEMAADFHALHPHITVKPTLTRGSISMDKIFAAFVGGSPPDVANVTTTTGVVWAAKGALRWLDDLLKRDRLNTDQMMYKAAAEMLRLQGKHFGLPQTVAGVDPILMYNRRLFTQVGLDPAKPPKTWQEVEQATAKLTLREGDRLTRVGLVPTNRPFVEWLHLNNGAMFTPDGRKVAFNSAEGQETLGWLADFTNRAYGGIAAVREFYRANRDANVIRGPRLPWYNDKEGMFAEIVSMFFRIDEEEPGFPLGAAVPPYNARNPKARSATVATNMWVYSMPAAPAAPSASQVEAAWTWLKYISVGDGARKALLAQKRPGAVRKFNEEKAYRELNPYWSDVVLKNLEGATPLLQTPASDDINKALGAATTNVLDGKQGVKEALSQAAAESQQALDAVQTGR
jgi:multiple sugar transport system substrate-binding protein